MVEWEPEGSQAQPSQLLQWYVLEETVEDSAKRQDVTNGLFHWLTSLVTIRCFCVFILGCKLQFLGLFYGQLFTWRVFLWCLILLFGAAFPQTVVYCSHHGSWPGSHTKPLRVLLADFICPLGVCWNSSL